MLYFKTFENFLFEDKEELGYYIFLYVGQFEEY